MPRGRAAWCGLTQPEWAEKGICTERWPVRGVTAEQDEQDVAWHQELAMQSGEEDFRIHRWCRE